MAMAPLNANGPPRRRGPSSSHVGTLQPWRDHGKPAWDNAGKWERKERKAKAAIIEQAQAKNVSADHESAAQPWKGQSKDRWVSALRVAARVKK